MMSSSSGDLRSTVSLQLIPGPLWIAYDPTNYIYLLLVQINLIKLMYKQDVTQDQFFKVE